MIRHAYNGFLVQWTFPIFIILSVSQCCPVVWRAWQCISKANAEPPRQEEFSSRGPSSYANLILGIGLTLSMFAWLLEPSQRNYLVVWLVQIMGKTENPAELCIVPPQWSTEGNSGERYGWASLMDVLEWTGGLGSIVLFYFIKLEFDRNSSFWVFLTVREVQSAFDFRS